MIIKNSNVKTIITMVFLMSFSCAWSMEDNKLEKVCNNKSINIIEFPLELVGNILSQTRPLEDGIKFALALSSTCHMLNRIPLDFFGKAFQHHAETEKNEILKAINCNNYWSKRKSALMVILSGALDTGQYPFMCKAVQCNDKAMLEILFKKGANPNKKSYGDPIFFYAKIKDVAELFERKKVDLNQKGSSGLNVLWYNIFYNSPLELVEFYVNSGVDVKAINCFGDCLLHYLVMYSSHVGKDGNYNYVKIGELLIKEIPEMVNTLNNKGNTPMDEAIKITNSADYLKETKEINKQLIELFKKYDGRPARQLQKQYYKIESYIGFPK